MARGRMRSTAEGEHRTGERRGRSLHPGALDDWAMRRKETGSGSSPHQAPGANEATGFRNAGNPRGPQARAPTPPSGALQDGRSLRGPAARRARNARAAWRCGGLSASPERDRANSEHRNGRPGFGACQKALALATARSTAGGASKTRRSIDRSPPNEWPPIRTTTHRVACRKGSTSNSDKPRATPTARANPGGGNDNDRALALGHREPSSTMPQASRSVALTACTPSSEPRRLGGPSH